MPVIGKLLLADARETLSAPPRFGDVKQIKARRFLERAEEFCEHLRACPRCKNDDRCADGTTDDEVRAAAWALLAGGGK